MEDSKNDFRHIVRIANTDLSGNKQIIMALQKIRGVGFKFANLTCSLAKVSKEKKTGVLTEAEVERLDKVLTNPKSFGAPVWMLNRRNDYETGEDNHIISTDLKLLVDNDKKRLQKIKAYKGVRHSMGLPVRGQRTKSNFRKNKGKAMGVKRSPQAKSAPK